jgi:ankyrin repeat protein
VNLAENDGWMPLHFAANNNHLDLVYYLVTRGADVTARVRNLSETQNTAYDLAKRHGYEEVCSFLVNASTNSGTTSSSTASTSHNDEAMPSQPTSTTTATASSTTSTTSTPNNGPSAVAVDEKKEAASRNNDKNNNNNNKSNKKGFLQSK